MEDFESKYRGSAIESLLDTVSRNADEGRTQMLTALEVDKIKTVEHGAQKNPPIATATSDGLLSAAQFKFISQMFTPVLAISADAGKTFAIGVPTTFVNRRLGIIGGTDGLITTRIEPIGDERTIVIDASKIKELYDGVAKKVETLDKAVVVIKTNGSSVPLGYGDSILFASSNKEMLGVELASKEGVNTVLINTGKLESAISGHTEDIKGVRATVERLDTEVGAHKVGLEAHEVDIEELNGRLYAVENNVNGTRAFADRFYLSELFLDPDARMVCANSIADIANMHSAINGGKTPCVTVLGNPQVVMCTVSGTGSNAIFSFEYAGTLYKVTIDDTDSMSTVYLDLNTLSEDVINQTDMIGKRVATMEGKTSNFDTRIRSVEIKATNNETQLGKSLRFMGYVLNYEELLDKNPQDYAVYKTTDGASYFAERSRYVEFHNFYGNIPIGLIIDTQTVSGSWMASRPVFAVWNVTTDSRGSVPHTITAMRSRQGSNRYIVFVTEDQGGSPKVVYESGGKLMGSDLNLSEIENEEHLTTESVIWNKISI